MIIDISEEDISKVQQLLFPGRNAFDEERCNFLRCLESTDVQACPGSGKTTLLVAKLLILAEKCPLPNGAGICVLTHTNNAVDEIRSRFRKQSEVLFHYPNFIGTIQSFVDTFLAIPHYVNTFGYRPLRISDEDFVWEVRKHHGVDTNKLREHFRHHKSPYTNYSIETLRFSFENGAISKSLMDEDPFVGKNVPSYQQARDHKLAVMRKGFLCFDDAYCLANRYLKSHPELVDLFCKRFAFVFVDEMQDTDIHQAKILDAVFPRAKTVIQYIGDRNQSIYSTDVRDDVVWTFHGNPMTVSGTKRLSREIAQVVEQLAIEPRPLVGEPRATVITPKVLVFSDDAIDKVIPMFCDLVAQYNLDKNPDIPRPVFKVVGWVGKPHENKHTIVSYYPWYVQNKRTRASSICCLDYLSFTPGAKHSAKFYRDAILEAIVGFLRLAEIVQSNTHLHTIESLLRTLASDDPQLLVTLQLNLTEWITQLFGGEDVRTSLRHFVQKELTPRLLSGKLPPDGLYSEFFAGVGGQTSSTSLSEPYQHPRIKFEVATVHAVKGQTHTATLYLETFYRQYDVQRLFMFWDRSKLPSEQSKKRTEPETNHALKMAYVGMSRPTHLLCVAVHASVDSRNSRRSRAPHELQQQLGDTWEVIAVTNS